MTFLPAMLPVISTVATVAGVGLNVAGSIAGAASESASAAQAREIALKNKQIAAENATRALLVSQEEQEDMDNETAALLGVQETVQAASGLKLSSGSFIHTRSSARQLGRIDALNIREAGAIRAEAYRNEGDAFAAEAAAASRAQSNAGLKGFLNVASSLVGGASEFAKTAPTRNTSSITVPGTSLIK